MTVENEKNYFNTRFVKIDNTTYIRQIKKHWFSRWKIVINPITYNAYFFSEDEVNSLWVGKAIEIISNVNDTNYSKWKNYILV